tara:strand:+ start:990 stop:1205 length:216 start_codon:yes stop_codon:yes gene_type:complete
MTDKYYIGLERLLNKHDERYIDDMISDVIQEKLIEKDDETITGFDVQINVTYQTEIDNSSSDIEMEALNDD